jgi:hypothetical protein
LLACGGDNVLSGSVSEIFDLSVSRMEVRKNDQALQVTYLRNRGVFLDVVARVSVALLDTVDGGVQYEANGNLKYLALTPGTNIKLGGEYLPGQNRTTIAHAPGGEPVRLLPPIKRGDLNIGKGGGIDELTAGDFSVLFGDEGGDLGNGRTMYGNFQAITLDGGFGPLP